MIPASVTPITVTARYVKADGSPAAGSVRFQLSAPASVPVDQAMVPVTSVKAKLDDNTGAISVTLAASDDPDWAASGLTYQVTERITGAELRTYNIVLPANAPGATVDLASLAPAVPGPPLVSYVLAATVGAVGGPAGPLDATGKLPATQVPALVAADVAGVETPDGAQAKADAAQDAAATDATTKANAAQAAAQAASAQRASNLSDLASPSAARTNLGLGTARRSSLFTPTRPGPATIVTTFQAGHGWTASNAGSSNLNDTSDFQLGSQAAKIVTATSGVTATLDSPTLTAVNLTGLCPRLLIKVEGQANQATLRFFAGDTAFTSFRNWNFGAPESAPLATFIKGGEWQWVTFNWTHASLTGADPRAAVTRFRLSAASTAGTALTVHVGAVTFVPEQSRWPNGVVSICFDDGRLSPVVNAKPKLDALGWAASAYPIVDRIGLASYATVAQLRQARDYSGWEMGVHASTAARHDAGLTALTPTQLEDEIAYCQDWSASNGLGNAEGIAWPLGLSDKAHEDAAAKLCGYGRGNVSTSRETWPAPIPMRIRSVAVSNSSSLPLIQGYVDEVKTNRAWLCLTFHEITTPGTATLEWPTASFNSLMDYIAAQGCAVAPMSQVLRNAGTVT